VSLTTPESIQKLQAALHDKAKKSPNFRFYALYDKVYRKDVLTFAYQSCKANGGAAGVDNQTFEDIEAYGAERWLDELQSLSGSGSTRPQEAASMAVRQTQGSRAGHPEISGSDPAHGVWAHLLDRADAQFFVGETVMFSTRAGCAKCACPVRRAGCGNGAWLG
jgi:hypothetical protein